VRSKNVDHTGLTKNIALLRWRPFVYWLRGYTSCTPVTSWLISRRIFGTFAPKTSKTAIDAGGYSNASRLLLPVDVLRRPAASIVSGTWPSVFSGGPFLILHVVTGPAS